VPVEDAEMTRMVRREISRRYVDASSLDVRVMHGVVYLRGWVERLHGAHHQDVDLKEEMEMIHRILVQRPGIRDVVVEVEFGKGASPNSRSGRK
jgi:hypothetical protein